jgi:hypothetical protein
MKKAICLILVLFSLISTSLIAEVKIFCSDPFYYGRTEIIIDSSSGYEGILGNYYDYVTKKINFQEIVSIRIQGESKIVQEKVGLVVLDLFENSEKVGTLTAYSQTPNSIMKFSELVYNGINFGNALECSF